MNVRALLTGSFDVDTLPPEPSKLVRVYVCSTATDTVEERHVLASRVGPQLRQYCRETYGLEFQFIDLHFGVEGDWSNACSERSLALEEIEDCRRISVGPSFIALIGQKYGHVPLPNKIWASDFELIRNTLVRHNGRDTRDAPLLDTWYKLDNYAVPPVYVLQTVDEVKPRPPSSIQRLVFNIADGTFSWPKTRALLQWLLKRGIELCVLQDSFSPESDCTQYLMSDLEREIDAGIVQSDDPAAGCVVFVRHIIDLKNYLDEPTASRFTELQYNPVEGRHEFDDEAGRCLDALQCEKIDPLLSAENIHTFDVLWRFDNGICATQHSNYLEDFCRRMRTELQQMVDSAAQAQCECRELPPFIDDVYHHWMLVKRKSEVFYGREELLEVVRSYVRSNDAMPLIIHGEFGCGKGSLIAKSVCQMPYWIVGELVTVVRYVGATRRSADIKQILYGICQQLNLVLGVDTGDIPMTWRGLRPYFVRLLSTFPSDKNLVVMLADLDRLPDDQHNAHALEWLPASLNENVKLVLATSDELPHMASARLRESLLRFENNIVRLLPEPTETCVEVLEQMLVKDGRRLTEEQRAIIEDALHECPLPLYMRFLLADAVDWTPNTIPSLPADVAGYVEEIFGRLERRHGAVIVAHALAYMSASETGVSDAEMDDLLSLDDAVLAEVYGARQRTVRRVPPTVWLRLKVDIGYFLRRCNYDGVSVSCWDRREFADAVAKRFMSGARTRRDTHSAMADYYLGTWSDVAKPYAAATPLSSAGPHRRRLVEQTPPPTARYAALRYVPHQPLILGRRSDGSTIYNLRKLRQLPTHLLAAGRLTELNEHVLFNYDWLHSKICAISLQSAIDDLALGGACVDAILVRTALLDAQSFVEVDVDSLASELSGRLLCYYSTHSNVARLVRQCDTIGSRCCGIVPAFPYHQVPGGPLKHRLECPGRPTTFALVGDAGRRRVLAKDPHTAVVTAFNIETGERLPDVDTSAGDMHVSPNGRYLVMVDGVERKSIKVHDAMTGAFTGHLIPMKHVHLRPKQKYAMVRICVSDMNVCALVTTEASFVCIAALDSCSMRHVIGLNGRSTLCDITPDGRHLFVNDAYQVIVYDLQTLERISAAPFESRPRNITFTRDATRALLLDESDDNRIVVQLLKDGRIEFSFKIALGDALYDDHVRHVCTSHVRDMVLVRGAENLLVYNIVSEQTMRHFRRPKKLPEEIRLPRSSSYAPVEFKHALFSADDRLVIAAIFRSVYVWSIDSDDDLPVATLQTPLGIIDQLFVSPDDVNIVTHTSGSSGVDVWSLDSAIGRISSIDSLTAPVAEIRLPDDDSVAFVRCTGSDELGIIDMRTGKLVDLLTHESPLQSFAITTDAEYALVTLKWSHVDLVNKIWHVTGRRVIYEFGAVGAHTVALRDSIAIVAVYQEHASFHAPYHVTLFRFADGSFDEYRLEPTLPFVLSAPFVTPDDKFLVALSATSYDERIGDYVEPTIVAVALNGPISMRTYGNDDMRDVVRMRRILHIRPYPKAIYAILVLFTKERRPTPERRRYDHCYDFMIFDVYNGVVCELIENFLTPSTSLERVLFPTDVSICVDDQSHVFDMRSGAYVKRIAGAPPSPPRCLALDGRVAMYADRRHLHAVRIADDRCIARVDVHADIECVFVGHDARTVVVGCRDGTVVAYVLVDAEAEDVTDILLAIRSRVCRPPSAADADDDCRRLRHRSWDKVDACDRTPSSRPPSAAVHKGPSDREVLSKVKLLERELFVPNNLWYRNRSKACSIM